MRIWDKGSLNPAETMDSYMFRMDLRSPKAAGLYSVEFCLDGLVVRKALDGDERFKEEVKSYLWERLLDLERAHVK